MQPFESAPSRGYRLNRKVYVREVRHLDDMPLYLATNPGGIAYIYRCHDGTNAEAATDRLCDRLGGGPIADPSLSAGAGARTGKRGSHGIWTSNIVFYGKSETARSSSRACSAPLVCPNMPEHLRVAPYALPESDADD